MAEQRLFVDVDDTLVLFDSEGEVHPYGFWRNDAYRLNDPLAEYIFQFRRDNPDALIVVWSGGGAEYAKAVIDDLLHGFDATPMIKDRTTFYLVREWDIVVDDQELRVPARVLRPDDPEITGK